VYIDHDDPPHGFTGWIKFKLSCGSIPNHGEKNALPRDGFSETFHVISSDVMRPLPAGTSPTAYAIHPFAGSCAAATATAEAAMAAMAAAAEMGRGVTWQNSHYKWIQKRSDSSFIV